jgi:hypothetical protein
MVPEEEMKNVHYAHSAMPHGILRVRGKASGGGWDNMRSHEKRCIRQNTSCGLFSPAPSTLLFTLQGSLFTYHGPHLVGFFIIP